MADQSDRYDIFVSYARADRARVMPMIAALEAPGWRVFWDHDIPPGWTWDEYIGAKLEEACVVLAVWSRESVRSEFVRTEASRARRRRVLVPVRIDDIEPPVEFERVHSADLIDWTRAPQPALPEVLHLEVTRRLAATSAPFVMPSLPAAAPAAIDRDDSMAPAAGYWPREAQERIRELSTARKTAMAELVVAQEALRESQSARDTLAVELKAVREALGEAGRKLGEQQSAKLTRAPTTAPAASATPWRWQDLDKGGRVGVVLGGLVLLILVVMFLRALGLR